MKATTDEIYESGKDPYVLVHLTELGIDTTVPEHVLRAVGDAALAVVQRYRRAGTACGHRQWGETARCAVMSCDQYVERSRRERAQG
jgi:hypothetical protein